MSKEEVEEVTLEELVSRAEYILHVRKMEPFLTTEILNVYKGSTIPPFKKRTYHYKVIDDFRNPGASIKGRSIGVTPAHEREDLELHLERHKDGTLKSTIRAYYDTKASLDEEEFIVLLNSRLDFCIGNAYVSISDKEKVLEMLKNEEPEAKAEKPPGILEKISKLFRK